MNLIDIKPDLTHDIYCKSLEKAFISYYADY